MSRFEAVRARCRGLLGQVFGSDLDDVFAYSTVKFVKIRDARLGSMHLGFQLAIGIYIVLFVLIRDGGYSAQEQPLGTVQFEFVQPTLNCSSKQKSDHDLYGNVTCEPNCFKRGWYASLLTPQWCFNDATPVHQLPYCRQYDNSSQPDPPALVQYKCEHFEADVVGRKWEPTLFVTTSITSVRQVRVCSAQPDSFPKLYQAGDCDDVYLPADSLGYSPEDWAAFKAANPWAPEIEMPAVNFVADVERYKLTIDHTVQADTLQLRNTAQNMKGRLYIVRDPRNDAMCRDERAGLAWTSPHGSTRASGSPCYLDPEVTVERGGVGVSGLDVFTLKELLAAGGVHLDDRQTNMDGLHTYRETGTTIVLSIKYTNRLSWELPTGDDISFEYRVTVLKGTAYRYLDSQWVNFDFGTGMHTKELLVRQGIRIVVVQSGMLWQFAVQVLLLQLTTSLALLAVAVTAVDAIALNILPNKKTYNAYKFQITEDFSDLRDGKVEIDLEEVQQGFSGVDDDKPEEEEEEQEEGKTREEKCAVNGDGADDDLGAATQESCTNLSVPPPGSGLPGVVGSEAWGGTLETERDPSDALPSMKMRVKDTSFD
eukprot:TRINITY_DN2029_c1_g1_i1.p1 TRINITY_DN2029_c1_g1~~TRINITY_DN2029_c1_g1_i1.p1  ORF type:complete len:609 (+),score=215.61 TRINITY_DN2029_c1_g1_i1:42-1829(+)